MLALACAASEAWAGCKLQSLEIPVRMVGARPVVTLGLNGTQVPMLLDTGAFYSALTESTAAQLKLPLHPMPGGVEVQGHTGRVDAKSTMVSKVQFNGMEVRDVEFIVGLNELGAGIMGVLGRNFLSMADTEYDLAHGVMRLIFPKGDCDDTFFAYWAGDAPVNVVPLITEWRGDTAIRVKVQINGMNVKAVMDTGASTSINLRVARRAGVQESDMVPIGRTGGAGAGHARSWSAPIASFELGGEKIANSRLGVDDADHTDTAMLLGIDYFLSHRIYVSKQQGQLYATWNGGPVFAQNKIGVANEARYAAAPSVVAANDADALARRGEAFLARGEFKRALEDLDRACALSPQSAHYFVSRARAHAAMRQPAKALPDLDEALRLDATINEARLERALLRARADDRPGALADLALLDQSLAPASHLRSGMGDAYERMALAPEALHQWELWASSHPKDAGLGAVLNKRCWLRARLKLDLPRALEDCKQAVAEDDENADFHDSLGWTQLRLDEPARALRAFDRAIDLKPTSPWPHYGRSQTHRRLGNAVDAARDLAAARKLDPKIDDKAREAGFDVER